MNIALLVIIALTSTVTMADGLGGADNHYDCILESLKADTSDEAAERIREECHEKFSDSAKIEYEALPTSLLLLLESTAKTDGGDFVLTVYNRSNIWYISELNIRITDKKSGLYQEYKAHYPWCEPLATCEFSYHPSKMPENISWSIVGGLGQHVP